MKRITWGELKKFIDKMNEEQLTKYVPALIDDATEARWVNFAELSENDIYVAKDDDETAGTLEDLKEGDGSRFNPDNYELRTPKGTPFLYITDED